jgi:hypothetical protein
MLGVLASQATCFEDYEHFDSYDDFLTEYYSETSKNSEVNFVKKHFPQIETHLNTEQYEAFLQAFLQDNLSGLDIDEEVAKTHKDHHEVLSRAYLEQRGKTTHGADVFELKDAFHDIIEGDFMFYLDSVEVKTPEEISEEGKLQSEVDSEIDESVKNDPDAPTDL